MENSVAKLTVKFTKRMTVMNICIVINWRSNDVSVSTDDEHNCLSDLIVNSTGKVQDQN